MNPTYTFLISLLLVLIPQLTYAEPAQAPLYLSVVPNKPNIMLMIDSSGSMGSRVSGDAQNRNRIQIAKEAATNLVNQLTPTSGNPTVRLGLSVYNSSYGGKLLYPLEDLDATHAATVKGGIASISAGGYTPLATTLSDIGYYFAIRPSNTGNTLTMHPGAVNQDATKTISQIFTKTDNSTILKGFDPAELEACVVGTTNITPNDCVIPQSGGTCQPTGGFNPTCGSGFSEFVDGGASTKALAEDTNTYPPVQMLVEGTKPVFCTAASDPVCATQIDFGLCASCGDPDPCPTCQDTTGDLQSIQFLNSGGYSGYPYLQPPTSASINIGGKINIDAKATPANTSISNSNSSSHRFSTTTPDVCEINDTQNTSGGDCDDTNCIVKGLADGTCRICTTYVGTQPPMVCKWSGTNNNCTIDGAQSCDHWSSNVCTKTSDQYYTDNGTDHLIPAGGSCNNGTYSANGNTYPCSSCNCWVNAYCAAENNVNSKYCSNKPGQSCSDNLGCYASCTNQHCSNDSNTSCAQNDDCYTSTCGAYNICSNDDSKSCSQTSDCIAGISCDTDSTGTCSLTGGTGCTGGATSCTILGNCINPSGRICSNYRDRSCNNNSECYDNTCDKDSGKTCTDGTPCDRGSDCWDQGWWCRYQKHCSHDGASCYNHSNCNPGVSCGNLRHCDTDATRACDDRWDNATCNITGGTCTYAKHCSNNNADCTASGVSTCTAGITCSTDTSNRCSTENPPTVGTSDCTIGDNSTCNPGVTCGDGQCAAGYDNAGATCSVNNFPNDCNTNTRCNNCFQVPPTSTCECTLADGDNQCAVETVDIAVGTGTTTSCTGGGSSGNTGGLLEAGNRRFDPDKWYTVQYNGSADIMGPYRGDQLNWYFAGNNDFTEGALELPGTSQIGTCAATDFPIQNWCQKSFAILISDGLPNRDRTVSDALSNYLGECCPRGSSCPSNSVCDANSANVQMPGVSNLLNSCGPPGACNKTGGACHLSCKNGAKAGRSYESTGSDYLDDVAKALYDMDLRPDLRTNDTRPNGKNNLITYTIGFADPRLNTNSILNAAAAAGGGQFFYADNADALANALNTVLDA
ncbi:hypothetical protein TI05_08505, partial [Achromatium sp. WMS3]